MVHPKNEQARELSPVTERPLAAAGLISYRAACPYGWVMIGAHDDADALIQARRSSPKVEPRDLQVWNGSVYVPCHPACTEDDHVNTPPDDLAPPTF